MINWNDFKLNLKACRAQAGYSQKDIADFMGISGKSIVDWETGVHSPTMDKAQRLSEIYGIPLERIDFTKKGNRQPTKEERAVALARLLEPDTVSIPKEVKRYGNDEC